MNLDNFTVTELGTNTKRKFNRVYLLEKQTEKYIQKVYQKTTPNFIEKLIRQESSFQFEHESLPKNLDFIETANEIKCLLQYKNGIPIDLFWKTISKKQRTSFLCDFIVQLIPILHELKDKGIVHCDLKPSNILIDGSASSFKIHLLDFGLAHQIQAPIEGRSTLFSLGFSAPELILNHFEIIDFRSDLFSLGCLIWYLFEGKIPFSSSNPALMTNLQITYPLPPGANFSKNWHKILQKMSAKEVFPTAPNRLTISQQGELLSRGMAKRYANFSDLIADLDQLKTRKKGWLFNINRV